MKTIIGLACLVLAIFLTPDAWNVLMGNTGVHGWSAMALHSIPALAAWAIGIWLVSTRSKSSF